MPRPKYTIIKITITEDFGNISEKNIPIEESRTIENICKIITCRNNIPSRPFNEGTDEIVKIKNNNKIIVLINEIDKIFPIIKSSLNKGFANSDRIVLFSISSGICLEDDMMVRIAVNPALTDNPRFKRNLTVSLDSIPTIRKTMTDNKYIIIKITKTYKSLHLNISNVEDFDIKKIFFNLLFIFKYYIALL